jgi:general secretion pathway protein G
MYQIRDNNPTRGFTLVELLVVIAIIGILVGTVVANVTSSRIKARDARRLSDMREVQSSLELYYGDCTEYPATLDVAANNGCVNPINLGSYLPTIPTDPLGGTYGYLIDANDRFVLSFTLEGDSDSAKLSAGAHTMEPDGFH